MQTETMFTVWYRDAVNELRSFNIEADDPRTAVQIVREQVSGLVEIEDVEAS